MAEPKTRPTKVRVNDFIDTVPNPERRKEARTIVALMRRVTGERPVMWGPSIIGFGTYTLRYASGKTADWPIAGFSPRKADLTLYIMPGFDRYADLLAKLGKHRTATTCLYLKRLSDVDLEVLEAIVRESVANVRKEYGLTPK